MTDIVLMGWYVVYYVYLISPQFGEVVYEQNHYFG